MPKQEFELDPSWLVTRQGQSLVVSAGADARYEVELETEAASFFDNLKTGQKFTRQGLSRDDQRIMEQLLAADIIKPVLFLKKTPKLRVATMGDCEALELVSRGIVTVTGSDDSDLIVITRAGETYADFLSGLDYQNIKTPHLLVDLSFHHTLSIGPYVFPGETACLACLQGRIGERWGDEQPPKAPLAAKRYRYLAQELTMMELDRIAGGDTGLVNKTISWDLLARSAQTNLLLKVPFCPICSHRQLDADGRVDLP